MEVRIIIKFDFNLVASCACSTRTKKKRKMKGKKKKRSVVCDVEFMARLTVRFSFQNIERKIWPA